MEWRPDGSRPGSNPTAETSLRNLGNSVYPALPVSFPRSAIVALAYCLLEGSANYNTRQEVKKPYLYCNGQNLFVHQLWEFICEGLTLSGCPRHVGRNYVPLFGVDTDLRYYVIRDVIVI